MIKNLTWNNNAYTWQATIEGETIRYKTNEEGKGIYYKLDGDWQTLKSAAVQMPVNLANMSSETREEYVNQINEKYGEAILLQDNET